MRTKKYIKYSLPADKYEIVDTFSLGEDDYITCDNCGKVIKNIAVVQNSKGKRYCVGMDCAETLSGITQDDIDYWNDSFVRAKSIRTKIRKYTKKGAIIRVQNMMGKKNIYVDILKVENPECLGDYYSYEEVSADFLKKYLPELAKIAKVNFDFIPAKECSFYLVNSMYDGYLFKKEIRTLEYNCKYAYAEIYKDGELLASGSNGGNDESALMDACLRLYNKVEFEKGLEPLI